MLSPGNVTTTPAKHLTTVPAANLRNTKRAFSGLCLRFKNYVDTLSMLEQAPHSLSIYLQPKR